MLKSFEPWSSRPLCVFSSFILFFLSRVCFVGSDLQGTGGRRLCVTIEPALLLKGDIMVSHMREGNNKQYLWHESWWKHGHYPSRTSHLCLLSAADCRWNATTEEPTVLTETRCSDCSFTPAPSMDPSSGLAKESWMKPVWVSLRFTAVGDQHSCET